MKSLIVVTLVTLCVTLLVTPKCDACDGGQCGVQARESSLTSLSDVERYLGARGLRVVRMERRENQQLPAITRELPEEVTDVRRVSSGVLVSRSPLSSPRSIVKRDPAPSSPASNIARKPSGVRISHQDAMDFVSSGSRTIAAK